MSRPSHILTKKYGYIDKKVWLTIGISFIICLGLICIRLLYTETCPAFTIKVAGYAPDKEMTYLPAAPILFSTTLADGRNVRWTFSDDGPGISGKEITHSFAKEGTYMVTAIIDGNCTESVQIHIRDAKTTEVVSNKDPITGPERLEAGVAGNFGTTVNAPSYEWSIADEPAYQKQYSATATYSFHKTGAYIIQLKLGNDKAVHTKKIFVDSFTPADKPGRPQSNNSAPRNPNLAGLPEESVPVVVDKQEAGSGSNEHIVITDEQFTYLLNKAAKGEKDLQSFQQFLCTGGKTRVLVNSQWSSFERFFEKISGNFRKFEVRSVKISRGADGCEQSITIKLKNKIGVFGL